MFIIKAETRDAGTAGSSYTLFEAARVNVSKSAINGSGPGPYPELEVRLFDQQDTCRETLYVGHGIDHFCAVFIMNERGKTVDSVYPGPRPDPAFQTYSGPGYVATVARTA